MAVISIGEKIESVEMEGGRWRPPTEEELEKVFQYFEQRYTGEPRKLERYSVVLENFVSDCPGYTGRLLFIVFGYPNAFHLFSFDDDGNISHVNGGDECE